MAAEEAAQNNAFATFTPTNLLARMAFSDLYERHIAGRQHVDDREKAFRIGIGVERVFDPDVEAFKRHLRRRADGKSDANPDQVSDTLPDTQSESEAGAQLNSLEQGMIWRGHFLLNFDPEPLDKNVGWSVGRRRPFAGDSAPKYADMLVCTPAFDEEHKLSIRHFQARFTFSWNTGQLGIARCTSNRAWPVTAGGVQVEKRLHILNTYAVPISVGPLQYELRYTDFAQTPEYFRLRNRFLKRLAGGDGPVDLPEIPTPRPGQRQFGTWVMGRALTKGGDGRVFEGTNTKDEVAALKLMRVANSRERARVDQEVSTNRTLTCLASTTDDGGRIVRQIEVIGGPDDDEIVSVLKPVTKTTLDAFISNHHSGRRHGMSKDGATALRELLLAVKFLHDHQFIHGNLKPGNVGIDLAPVRVTLLEVGTASQLKQPDDLLPPSPGSRGSVHYLAPECELQEHDASIDIWAIGVIAHQLTYGYNPFKFRVNPWREGRANGRLRRDFIQAYEEAIARLGTDYQRAMGASREGFIHLGPLIKKLLRFPRLDRVPEAQPVNTGVRITVDKALSDPSWGPEFLNAGDPRTKKRRGQMNVGVGDDGPR